MRKSYRCIAGAVAGMIVSAMGLRAVQAAPVEPTTRAVFAPTLGPEGETPEHHDARMGWWREARFGMFIHWGRVRGAGRWGVVHDQREGADRGL